jgi:hypothetical protein
MWQSASRKKKNNTFCGEISTPGTKRSRSWMRNGGKMRGRIRGGRRRHGRTEEEYKKEKDEGKSTLEKGRKKKIETVGTRRKEEKETGGTRQKVQMRKNGN